MLKQNEFYQFSTFLLAQEAQTRGIKVTKIFPGLKNSYLKLKLGNKIDTIIGQRVSSLSFNAYFICKHKEMTRRFLKESGIKTVEGRHFQRYEIKKAVQYAKKIKFPVVVKPVDETWGKGVHLDIRNTEETKKAIKKILKSKGQFLIEKQFIGNEYRILATRDKLLGVINRIPANIIGDGENTIQKLIKIKNQDPHRGKSHESALVKIKIDGEVKKNLKEKSLAIEHVPKKGEIIFLRKNSNISTGGDSVDVTDEAHPKIKILAPKIIRAIPGLPYAGFDFMTSNITKDPDKAEYAVIEINDSPMLSMHHFPYKGKKRNVAKDIIDLVF